MTITTGTSHFVSRQAANKYYATYGYSSSDVEENITSGQIHIGEPSLKPGERLTVIKDEGRYAIVTKA